MPKVVYTETKGLVQETGTGFTSDTLVKVHQLQAPEFGIFTFQAENAGNYSGGKHFLLSGQSKNYAVYFSSIDGAAQTVPTVAGAELVSIGNIAAGANATTVGAAVETAVRGISEFLANNSAGAVTIQGAKPGKALNSWTIGTIASTSLAITSRSAGAGTWDSALKTTGINEISMPVDALNFDGTGAPDGAKLTLAAGPYVGAECTIARTDEDDAITIITVSPALRHIDGGNLVADDDLTITKNSDDGSPLIKLVYDGKAWMPISAGGGAAAEFGWSY